ncbi:MAG: hypothetical protein EZS26_002120 [Candidatus Ordinivivax streblomastigis]|uniref:Uncharacterized protein n=1 Tax=Candidatus Ordinivivax streblomastigis TaxID=2540710 RepID=A0A5M8NZR2_9BACT|nr:MAG: hypothetical protein EZS26_002120 [Candidatus Ordinivivax streblomastigis]
MELAICSFHFDSIFLQKYIKIELKQNTSLTTSLNKKMAIYRVQC